MSVFRRATVMPTSQCSTSPGWITGSSPRSSRLDALALDLDARLEPGAEALIVRPAAATTTRDRSCASCPARSPRPRTSSASSARRARSSCSKNASSSGSREAIRSSGSAPGVLELRRPRRTERGAHALQLSARQAVAERKHRRTIDADDFRIALFDHLLQRLPLLVAPELGLPAADRRRRPSSSSFAASNTPPCDVPPSAIRSTHGAEAGAPAAAHLSKNT